QNMEKGYSPNEGSAYSSDGSNTNDRDDGIRPAAQTSDREVGDQKRPANQNMNKGYNPTQGSDYSSSGGSSSSSSSSSSSRSSGSNAIPTSNTGGGNDVVGEQINPEIIVPTIVIEYELESTLTSDETDATGFGKFFIDTTDNTFDFNIEYEDLGSAETSANIKNNQGILFALPLGMSKSGTWNFHETFELDLLNGDTIVTISSLMFPGGELIGSILRI
ncbi:CHRD domain-containing protein, partial [Candidatus Pacearchaeota archaeon]|nr:CHRD domain-containing protein [Candidatus Pacearchaeota archaeon]